MKLPLVYRRERDRLIRDQRLREGAICLQVLQKIWQTSCLLLSFPPPNPTEYTQFETSGNHFLSLSISLFWWRRESLTLSLLSAFCEATPAKATALKPTTLQNRRRQGPTEHLQRALHRRQDSFSSRIFEPQEAAAEFGTCTL